MVIEVVAPCMVVYYVGFLTYVMEVRSVVFVGPVSDDVVADLGKLDHASFDIVVCLDRFWDDGLVWWCWVDCLWEIIWRREGCNVLVLNWVVLVRGRYVFYLCTLGVIVFFFCDVLPPLWNLSLEQR